jgi:hypothetical protein
VKDSPLILPGTFHDHSTLLNADAVTAKLFTASLLSRCKGITNRDRCTIISRVRPFDIHSTSEARHSVMNAIAAVGIGTVAAAGFTETALHDASCDAEAWLGRGVYPLSLDDRAAAVRAYDIPKILFARGDRSILARPTAAILISRQGRKITPEDRWLTCTKHLLRIAIDHDYTVVSSFGNIPYAVVSTLTLGHPLIVVCQGVLPFMRTPELCKQFLVTHKDMFDAERTLFVSSFSPGLLPPPATRLGKRDRLVAALGSILLVAEVSVGGNMEAILDIAVPLGHPTMGCSALDLASSRSSRLTERQSKNAVLDEKPRTEKVPSLHLSAPGAKSAPRFDSEPVELGWDDSAEVSSSGSVDDEERSGKPRFLIHYTRSCPGPWSGQTLGEYCRSLIDASPDASHTALDTLRRILKERLIRGSNKLTRGISPVVSFTECLSEELQQLIRWRRGLVRWSFEPYGIAIRTERLVQIGAKRVLYGDEDLFHRLPAPDKHLFQSIKPGGNDWSVEKEWRLLGDLDLVTVPREDVVAIVPDSGEAAMIRREFGLHVVLAAIAPHNGSAGAILT